MQALDTNVLVRFLVADDPGQADQVRKLLKRAEAEGRAYFVPLPVVLETIWVLQSVYDIGREDILDALHRLMLMPVLAFDRQDALDRCLHAAREDARDLADLLIGHAALDAGCSTVLTFNRRAASDAPFTLLAVEGDTA